MSHLIKFRKGWQCEHLAKFIISKFAFIAEPSNISDDLGSDFYCTMFVIKEKGQLLPQSSFSIQIKSNSKRIEITNKLSYLQNLEMPFFVGVVNRSTRKITIYSGESIPHFFSLYGTQSQKPESYTFINLIEIRDNKRLVSRNENIFELFFPKILELDSSFDYEKEQGIITPLLSIISTIQKNISSCKALEYVFNLVGEDGVIIYSGSGSAKTYRDNLFKRLAEAFLSIRWIALSSKKEFRLKEFHIYEKALIDIQDHFNGVPYFLASAYQQAREVLKKED